MKLQRLDLKRFGQFDEYSLAFTDGINIFYGTNESGKSTLMAALLTVLYDDPTQQGHFPRRFLNWDADRPGLLHLEFSDQGKQYRLTKDFSIGIVLLEETDSGARWTQNDEVQRALSRILGSSSREFLLGSFLVRQGQLDQATEAADLIKTKLEKMTGNGRDDRLSSHLIERLQKRIKEIDNPDPSSPGEIQLLQRCIESWENELEANRRKISDSVTFRQRLQSLSGEISGTRQLFGEKHELFRRAKRALEAEQSVEKEREVLQELMRRTKESQETKELINCRNEKLRSLVRIDRAELKSAGILAAQNSLYRSKLEDASARCEKEKEVADATVPQAWSRILTAVSFMVAVISIVLWYKSPRIVYLGSSVALIILTVVFLSFWFAAAKNYRNAVARKREADEKWQEERDNLHRSDELIKGMLEQFRVNSVDEMSERYEEYHDLEHELRTLTGRYDALVGESNLRDLENEVTSLKTRIEDAQATYEKHRSFSLLPDKLDELQREVAHLDKKLRTLENDEVSITHKLRYIESGADTQAALEERVEEGNRRITLLAHEHEQLTIILRYLDAARRRILKSSIELLEEESSRLFNDLTDGVWRKLRVNRQSMKCEVTKDGTHWQEPENSLSQATLDSLALALRFALVKVVTSEVSPPVILDEPFVFLDNRRRELALKLLKEVAENHQIILLTAHHWYESLPTAKYFQLERSKESVQPAPVTV